MAWQVQNIEELYITCLGRGGVKRCQWPSLQLIWQARTTTLKMRITTSNQAHNPQAQMRLSTLVPWRRKRSFQKLKYLQLNQYGRDAFPIWGWILSLFKLGWIKLYCFWRAMSEDWFKNAMIVGPRFFGIAIYNDTSRFMSKWITKASSASKFFNYNVF